MKHGRTIDREVRNALVAGHFILVASRKHLKYRHPVTGKRVVISSTPSGTHAKNNQLREIRKAAQ